MIIKCPCCKGEGMHIFVVCPGNKVLECVRCKGEGYIELDEARPWINKYLALEVAEGKIRKKV